MQALIVTYTIWGGGGLLITIIVQYNIPQQLILIVNAATFAKMLQPTPHPLPKALSIYGRFEHWHSDSLGLRSPKPLKP